MNEEPAKSFGKLSAIVDRLMGDNGCPWDRVQTRESLKPYLVEETYEVLEALDSNDPEKIKDELGDLMYQILFHSKISELQDEFSIRDVVDNLSEKMVRRHPHIFEAGELHTPDQVLDQWETIKKKEKASQHHKSVLDGVPNHLPALAYAQKLTRKAAKHGFDWDRITDVFAKLDEEIAEFKSAVLQGQEEEIAGELGDILFVLVNVARHQKIDAEEALRRTNNKFVKRFQHIERAVEKTGKTLKETPLADLERHWQDAKKK
ncbi:MAG: nucleoside triphosphate pyrophosphohydrolase [Nitrospina sp.]|nr:MAG: nucleoside triphosphate pyrophosphohydrolase [Nitrospina sp.]